ncbi:MAG: hypothetical protein ABIH41_01035 [Nanoarchaeota archaeon]
MAIEAARRGMVFTLIALLSVVIIMVIAASVTRYSFAARYESIESRVRSMDDFIDSFHADAQRAMYIAGFRSFIAMEDYVSENAVYLNDSSYYFRQLFYNGTIAGEEFDILNDSTFYLYQTRVADIARTLDIDFSSSVNSIRMYQDDPWKVIVEVDIFVNISDRRGLAAWQYNTTLVGVIPIDGLRDPL